MSITTIKHLPLLISVALITACSTQNTSVSGSGSGLGGQSLPGSQNTAGGQQSIPGTQLFRQRSEMCIDKATGKAIPGCKSPTTVASAKKVQKLPTAAKTSTSSSSMRKIVLKAPKKTIQPITVAKPNLTKPIPKPIVSRGVTTSAPAPVSSSNLRPRDVYNKVMNKQAPAVQPRRVAQPAPRRPAAAVRRPVVTQPYRAPTIANPVRSAPPVRRPVAPVRPVIRPAAPAPVQKPQSTMRRLTLNGSTNFKSGSSRLTPAGQTELLALALSLQEGSTKISRLLIEGHTDGVGNAAMNQVLSLKRANSVADYLSKQGGFTRSMMETVGLGESKPVASNKTRKGRALNRRVEITATGTRQSNR